jgi:hypothetical protein
VAARAKGFTAANAPSLMGTFFGYDAELLAKNEIDDKALIDLWGVVKVSEVNVHGASVLNFDGFAPAAKWEELSVFANADPRGSEVAS